MSHIWLLGVCKCARKQVRKKLWQKKGNYLKYNFKNPDYQVLEFTSKLHLLITQTSGSFFEAAYNKFKTYNTTISYNGTEEFLCGNYLKECLKNDVKKCR